MYQDLIPTARRFYSALAQSNTRDWWQENRAPYDDQLKPGALALLDEMAPVLSDLADAPVTGKLFRPHRDVRFSKDKTPYNTHLHMMWQIDGGGRQNPVFFFGIGLDYISAGAGLMGFDKPVLEDWRKFVDLDTNRIQGIIDGVTDQGFTLREPALKRVPSAYPKDHPAADLLRMKGLVASGEIAPDTKDIPKALTAAFTALWPINALLIQISEA